MTECYNARNSPFLRTLDHHSLEGGPHNRAFKDLRHFIGRLGAHRKATKTIVAAVAGMPGFLDGFSIEVERSSAHALCKLLPEDTTAFKIIGRMCPKDAAQQYRDTLRLMDSSYGLNMDAGLAERCTFETRVHAELLLLDLFMRKKYEFVGGDRYIGCSKPACYSCYQYFLAQNNNFVLPACHNKLYLYWRPPDVFDEFDLEAIERRTDTMNKMNTRIRNEIKEQLERRAVPKHHHFDSTTGKSLAIDIEVLHESSYSERCSFNVNEASDGGLGKSRDQETESWKEDLEEGIDGDLEGDLEIHLSEDSEIDLKESCEEDSDGGAPLI